MNENPKDNCRLAALIKEATELAIENDDVGHLLTHMANSVAIQLEMTSHTMDEMLDGLKDFGEQVIGIAIIIDRIKRLENKKAPLMPSDDEITDDIKSEVQAFLKTLGGTLDDPPKPH